MNKLQIGSRIQVQTCLDEVFEGVVYTVDTISNFLIIEQENTSSESSIRMFQFNSVKHVEILDQNSTNFKKQNKLPFVSESELLRLEQKNHQMAQKAIEAIGPIGISQQAQDIFDALNKTMPCKWEKENIRVMDEVLIQPPYSPTHSCSSKNEQVLTRVRKVLQGEIKKLEKNRK